jgi:uncharacterized protein YndB with AHSA1/START domain
MNQVVVDHFIPAPVDQVWAQYSDYRSWSDWAGLGPVRVDRPGSPEPGGVGCVRVVGPPGFAAYEEVTSFEPGRMTYRVLKGGPTRDHLGEVTVQPHLDGALLRWRIDFRPRVPATGLAVEHVMALVFWRALTGLRRHLTGA